MTIIFVLAFIMAIPTVLGFINAFKKEKPIDEVEFDPDWYNSNL